MKKIALIAVLLLALSLSACGIKAPRGSAPIEQARAEFEKMCTAILEDTRNLDGESIAKYVKCYPEGWDEMTIMSNFQDFIDNGFADFTYYLVPLDEKGEFYAAGMINYGEEDEQFVKICWTTTISFTDGSCKIDCNDEAEKLINSADIYPTGMKEAAEAGRYYANLTENDWSFADPGSVIKGRYEVNAYCMWQNEDGSMSIAYSIKNGTEKERKTGDLYISVTKSDGSGMVVEDHIEHTDYTLKENSAVNIIVNIPADELQWPLESEGDFRYICFIRYSAE